MPIPSDPHSDEPAVDESTTAKQMRRTDKVRRLSPERMAELHKREELRQRRERFQTLGNLTAGVAIGAMVMMATLVIKPIRFLKPGPYVPPIDSSVRTKSAPPPDPAWEKEMLKVFEGSDKPLSDIEVLQARTATIAAKLDATADRIGKIESVILADPAKALEMNLLKRDLENIQAMHKASMESIKDGAERVYDMLKWIVGLTVTSIISLAATTFLKGSAKSKD